MKVQYAIDIPTVSNNGVAFDQDILDVIVIDVVDKMGGCFVSHGTGLWMDDSGRLYRDSIMKVTSTGDDTDDVLAFWLELGARVRVQLNQDAVYVTRQSTEIILIEAPADNEKLLH